jgi:hypothetical protein
LRVQQAELRREDENNRRAEAEAKKKKDLEQ